MMTNQSTTPENAISRRHFLLSASLATTALGLKPLTGMGAPTRENPARANASGKLCLWYDRPAKTWMTEALPIGNGRLGAMVFGGTVEERLQLNESTLWGGLPHDYSNPAAGQHLAELRRPIFAGKINKKNKTTP